MSFNFSIFNRVPHDVANLNARLAMEMSARNSQEDEQDNIDTSAECESNDINYRKLMHDALNTLRSKPNKSDSELHVLKARKTVALGKIITTVCCALTVVSLVGYALVQLVLPSVVLPVGTVCVHEGLINGNTVQYESYCSNDGIRNEHLCHGGDKHTHMIPIETLGFTQEDLKNTSTVTVYLDANYDPISAVANKDVLSLAIVMPVATAIVMPIMICIAFYCLARYGFGKPWYEWRDEYQQKLENQESVVNN